MKQQKDFSIQDWKSDHFYNLIEEGDGVSSDVEQKFLDMGGDDLLKNAADLMIDGGSYSDIMQLVEAAAYMAKNGFTGDQLTMFIANRFKDQYGDLSEAPMTEAIDLKSMFPAVDQGEMDNDFFMNLFDALDNYFEVNADKLTNMDAKYLAHICRQASKAIKVRSSN